MKMTNMARSPSEIKEASSPILSTPIYAYGLRLSFDQETLDKLNLDTSDAEVGDMLHMGIMGEISSISKHDCGSGERCNIEFQITHIGVAENESKEYEAD